MTDAVKRVFVNDDDEITLTIHPPADGEAIGYRFEVSRGGDVLRSSTLYGEDRIQALLFCLTAAGDFLAAEYPNHSWLGSGATGLPTVDRGVSGRWQASVWYPSTRTG